MKQSDTRDPLWAELERDIQSRGRKKDAKFRLRGAWKRRIETRGRFTIYLVDGEWVRNNLSIIFGHGGHGLVHEFIPLDEIWVDRNHFKDCGCTKRSVAQRMSPAAIQSTIVHEIVEFQLMKKGASYWQAHMQAHKAELAAGFLKDLYNDTQQ